MGSTGGGAAISAGSGLLGSVIGGIFGAQQQKREFENQKSLMELNNKYAEQAATTAYERQVEQWDRENEYNTPAAQRARLEEAGLNPALMYGTGGAANAGNAGGLSTVPQNEYAAGGVYRNMPRRYDKLDSMSQMADIFTKTADVALKLNQAKREAADTGVALSTINYTQAMTELTQHKSTGQRWDNAIKEVEYHVRAATESDTIDEIRYHAKSAFENFRILKAEADVAKDISEEERKQKILATNRAELGLLQDNLGLILAEANIRKTEGEIALLSQQLETECAKLGFIDSQIAANEAQAAMFGANASLAEANAEGVRIDNLTRGEMNEEKIKNSANERRNRTVRTIIDGVGTTADVIFGFMTGGFSHAASKTVGSLVTDPKEVNALRRSLESFTGQKIVEPHILGL